MQQTIHGDCTELTAFVCEHLSVCLDNLFPGKRSTVFIILIESMNKINCFLGHCFTFFLRRLCKYPLSLLQFSCRSNEIFWNSKYSEQYFRDQESGTKVNICNFSIIEVVSNFSLIAAYSLSSSSAWFLVSLSYVEDGSLISISETLYAADMFSWYTFKTFFSLPFYQFTNLPLTPWILTGESPMLLRVELSFFFGDSYSKKSSSDANSSCELSASIISVMFSISGGLVNFPYLVTHWLHNFWPGNTFLNPFSFSILAILRFSTL